jgi:uracil-DNA glycosylase
MSNAHVKAWTRLNRAITRCTLCPRLRAHCAAVARTKRAAFTEQTYWGRPVPNLAPADPNSAGLLIVGLAPAAHGANRTGRVFTGDRSGDFLFRAMHSAGFVNQPTSRHASDGLELIGCAIAGICRCAPPDNKPTPQEIETCRPFLDRTFELLPGVRCVVALGKLAFDASVRLLNRHGFEAAARPAFSHGGECRFVRRGRRGTSDNVVLLLATYHPSQQNTFAGRLTPGMLEEVFVRARGWVKGDRDSGRPGPCGAARARTTASGQARMSAPPRLGMTDNPLNI